VAYRLQFTDDPAAFLAGARDHLGQNPVLNTVVATTADRSAGDRSERDDWYLTVRDEQGAVVGVGMRTAPFEPRPLYLLPMPDQAALMLARALHDRGEPTGGVNGALPAVTAYAEECARLWDCMVRVGQHTRLFELSEVVEPARVPGRMRLATADDHDLVGRWLDDFHDAAAEQAGRPRALSRESGPDPDAALRRIEAGGVWLWEQQVGEPVHLTGCNRASLGAQRIGPVYTPVEHRGHGYASAAVAEVSRRILAEGATPCLFTDQANPTSNKIYQALGYRPVVDMINLQIV